MKILMVNDMVMLTLDKSEAETVANALHEQLPYAGAAEEQPLLTEIVRQLHICLLHDGSST
jgi:hypothetical protein